MFRSRLVIMLVVAAAAGCRGGNDASAQVQASVAPAPAPSKAVTSRPVVALPTAQPPPPPDEQAVDQNTPTPALLAPCDQKPMGSVRDACISATALEQNMLEFCAYALLAVNQTSCLEALAAKTMRPAPCYALRASKDKRKCLLGIGENDAAAKIDPCDDKRTIAEAERCYFDVASETQELHWCARITPGALRAKCDGSTEGSTKRALHHPKAGLADEAANVDCDSAAAPMECLRDAALEHRNASFCARITKARERELCVANLVRAEPKTAHCKPLAELGPAYDECLNRVASVSGDMSACKLLTDRKRATGICLGAMRAGAL